MDSEIFSLGNKKLFKIGFSLLLVNFLILIPLIFFAPKIIFEKFEFYNFETIKSNGYIFKAKILDVMSKKNISMDGQHPDEIRYEYSNNGKVVIDKFRSLDFKGLSSIRSIDSIKIYVYKNESVIKNIQPFYFPFKKLWIGPLLFGFFSFIFLVIGKYVEFEFKV